MQSYASSNKNSDENKSSVMLVPDSKLYTDFDVVTQSNYTLAIRSEPCQFCEPLKVSIQDKSGKFVADLDEPENSLYVYNLTSDPSSNWFYARNLSLIPGKYDMQIYSESPRRLDLVMLYSSGDDKTDEFVTVEDLFSQSFDAATVKDYKKINPTKHVVSIANATRPYLLSFAESFDPLWTAKVNKHENHNNQTFRPIHSNPSFSIINSFYIDVPGEYDILVEFRPQQWVIEGGIIGMATILVFMISYIFVAKYKIGYRLLNLWRARSRTLE
jgi:hypothetical protein